MVSLKYILIFAMNISFLEASKYNKHPISLSPLDPTSFSRPEECLVKKLHLSLNLDFTNNVAYGKVDLEVIKRQPNVKHLILDSKGLHIFSIEKLPEGTSLDNEESSEIKDLGSKLTITLPIVNSTVFNIRIKYKTSPDASGLYWLPRNQTAGKEMPFLFSQFETIHARSFLPCQDTPAVRTPYTADITAPQGIIVLMSAIRVSEPVILKDKLVRYTFEQKVPIPSYLIAIAAGKLESRKLAERSRIWAEPQLIAKTAHDLGDIENILKTSEDICGSYIWGIYDLLVVPSVFPLDGMENPCLTFISIDNFMGDNWKLLESVTHEIAHSWTGNLVTNRNFEHFWLNEGFTVFTERKITGRIKGRAVQDFEYLMGLKILQKEINNMGESNPLSKLVIDLRGVHADAALTKVPYEKGCIFLRYLENVVGGPEKFEPFFKKYLDKYKYKAVDTDDFKNTFLTWFKDNKDVKKIDWNRWLYTPGMPPMIPNYDKTLANPCIALKNKWVNWNGNNTSIFSPKDLEKMEEKQIFYFLKLILEHDPMPINKLEMMERLYKLNSITTIEIKTIWYLIGLKAHWVPSLVNAYELLLQPIDIWKIMDKFYQEFYEYLSK